ncbi:hypothetical protein J4474_00750 [Candidatus Pacearchaeota archaeon]|nr:hypothetical protein [Candidatus Pacearchaeota archaeon]
MRYVITQFEEEHPLVREPFITLAVYFQDSKDVEEIVRHPNQSQGHCSSDGIFYDKTLNVSFSLDRANENASSSFPKRSIRMYGKLEDCHSFASALERMFEKNKLKLEPRKK